MRVDALLIRFMQAWLLIPYELDSRIKMRCAGSGSTTIHHGVDMAMGVELKYFAAP